ncbi:pyridoxamine 5'-phosphate oxidase family protein [Ceratobasidium sp. AG-Ba]|nr:pyridoxamine 5'-phosphate oxidase family protein [Ceratobasidium sp. AG-Ba]
MPTLSLSPRWLSHLTGILAENKKSTIYALATVDTDGSSPIPRVRHVVHRDILTTHPTRPLLISTTDVRTPKVHQLRSHPDSNGPTSEAAWWIGAASVQFRIGARTHILPAQSSKLHSGFPFSLLSSAGGGDSGPESPETAADWEKFRIKTFNALPPFLRASFARPIPGTVLANQEDAKAWPTSLPETDKAESEEDKKHIKGALENFALVVLEPLEVEFLELGVEPNRRTRWKLSEQEWRETLVVP